jgi:hypothetical protein
VPDETWYPAVQPPDSLRDRLLAEVARLEAMPLESLLGPWGEAARLKAIVEGRDC